MVPVIFYRLLGGAQVPISAYLTATFRFVNRSGEMKLIFVRILSPVSDVVDTTTLELKEEIAT